MICNTYKVFFRNLSDQTKLKIIKILRNKPCSVGEICKKSGFEQSRVSHNLKKLRYFGFVNVIPEGKQRIYSIDKKTILPLLKLIDNHVDSYYKHYCRCKGNVKDKIRRKKE